MQKKIPLSIAVLILLLVVIVTYQVTHLAIENSYREKVNDLVEYSEGLEKLMEVDDLFRNNYVGDIDEDMLLDGIISGYIAGTGDKYGYYLNSNDYADYMDELDGNIMGIGVYIVYNPDFIAIEVTNVIENSPAHEAGLLPGDLITAVDGVSVSEMGYYTAVSRVKGEEGTMAEITVYRDGESIDYSIERRAVTSVSVEYRMYKDTDIGIVRISTFDAETPKQFEAAIKELTIKGAVKFIFDLRNNLGGEINSIVSVLDYLLPEGPIVKMVDKDGNVVREYQSDASELSAKMAVLVNEYTASAAELFSSALKDYEKATLVGKTTFGKGTAQTIVPLSDGSGVAISYMMCNPPFSENYEGVGVVPNVEIDLDEEYRNVNLYKLDEDNDAQLIKAVEIVNS